MLMFIIYGSVCKKIDEDSAEMEINHAETYALDEHIDALKASNPERFSKILKETTWVQKFDMPDNI
jgi:hypothetical protein